METSQNNVGDEVSSMSGAVESLKEELIQQRKITKGLQHSI